MKNKTNTKYKRTKHLKHIGLHTHRARLTTPTRTVRCSCLLGYDGTPMPGPGLLCVSRTSMKEVIGHRPGRSAVPFFPPILMYRLSLICHAYLEWQAGSQCSVSALTLVTQAVTNFYIWSVFACAFVHISFAFAWLQYKVAGSMFIRYLKLS